MGRGFSIATKVHKGVQLHAQLLGQARIPTLSLLLLLTALCLPSTSPAHQVSNIPSIVPPWLINEGIRFTLIDHTGKTVTEKDYAGEMILVYFGYTSCPDVCPTMLQTVATTLDRIGADAARIRPLFISVDAKHDTPEILAKYVGYFHPRLVGLTGSKQQIFNAAKRFGVRYYTGKVQGEYEVGHADNLFLFSQQGKLLEFITQGATVEDIEKVLRHRLRDDASTQTPSRTAQSNNRSGAKP